MPNMRSSSSTEAVFKKDVQFDIDSNTKTIDILLQRMFSGDFEIAEDEPSSLDVRF
jgi:hypothetical protein